DFGGDYGDAGGQGFEGRKRSTLRKRRLHHRIGTSKVVEHLGERMSCGPADYPFFGLWKIEPVAQLNEILKASANVHNDRAGSFGAREGGCLEHGLGVLLVADSTRKKNY